MARRADFPPKVIDLLALAQTAAHSLAAPAVRRAMCDELWRQMYDALEASRPFKTEAVVSLAGRSAGGDAAESAQPGVSGALGGQADGPAVLP